MRRVRQPKRKYVGIDTRRQPEAGTGEDISTADEGLGSRDNSLATTAFPKSPSSDQTEIEDTTSFPEATTLYQTGRTWPDVAHEWLPIIRNSRVLLGAVPLAVFLVAIATGNLKSLAELGLVLLVSLLLDILIWFLSSKK